MRRVLREIWMGLGGAACVLAYLFPYFYLPGTWWRAIPSTLVILLIGAITYGRPATKLFGLLISPRELAISVVLCAALLPLFSHLLSYPTVSELLTAERHINLPDEIHQFFQVLNDEILLRAALLTFVLRVFPHPKTVVVIIALLFAIAHHLVYRPSSAKIGWAAMATLFSFGAIANNLFVRYRHIGYGFALHYAWNFLRFNTTYYLDGLRLSEGETFNYIEGNIWVASASFATFALGFAACSRSGYWQEPPGRG